MLALAENNPNSSVSGVGGSSSGNGVRSQGPSSGLSRRGGNTGKRDSGTGRTGGKAGSKTGSVRGTPAPTNTDAEAMDIDTEPQGSRSALLAPFEAPASAKHAEDLNPLLESWIPQPPTDAELRLLLTEAPLKWTEARGSQYGEEEGYPVRKFCNVCGYWGRVKCVKCSARICGMECLAAHQDECVRRYGI
jgi:zinc finger HIT domain-containing protein 1